MSEHAHLHQHLDGGEAVLQALRDLGVDLVTSSPGSEWVAVWEAFARARARRLASPRFLSCGHELLAVGVAAGWARATGRLPAVLLHAGVGLLQGAMGLHGARLARLPLLALSGETQALGDGEDFDPGVHWTAHLAVRGGSAALAATVCKHWGQVGTAATLYEQVRRAGALAREAPAGPAHLAVPIEAMRAPWTPPHAPRAVAPPPALRPAAADVERAARRLATARHPVIVTGAAGRDGPARRALVELARALAIPVVEEGPVDYANFPTDDPLHQGFAPRSLVDAADVVLVVRSRVPWYPVRRGPGDGATVMLVDEAPIHEYLAHQSARADLMLGGDVAATLGLLLEALAEERPDQAAVEARRAACRAGHARLAEAREAQRAAALAASRPGAIAHAALCAALARTLPASTIWVDETSLPRRDNLAHLPRGAEGSYHRSPNGLGQGMATALGLRLADGQRQVAALVGDGAFFFNPAPAALALAGAAGLPFLTVVLENGGYESMRRHHRAHYPNGDGERGGWFPGGDLAPGRCELIAEAFGGVGLRVEDPAALDATLTTARAALDDGRAAIVSVTIQP